ncbi:hypothetical protein [Streptomyces sp. SPB162]|uniref:hypothetical protein n=1 Tax=Streptomyces sp. SPB162 TaxID=2940560 RepID=UPI002404E8AD|nr:hypothetical protein [Streptomyces sp. SPB162]MDF9810771.1 hypothetical protein [Streptomyces sp. SPB162]
MRTGTGVEEFVRIRKFISDRAPELIQRSIEEQAVHRADAGVPLLTKEGWIPPGPLPLSDVRLRFQASVQDDHAQARTQCARYWPEVAGKALPTYSDAVSHYQAPGHFFNGKSFRLLEVDPSPLLTFTEGSYFDAFDTCEPLGFEAAKRFEESEGRSVLGLYRRWLADPFDLSKRCCVPGVNTLTIRRAKRDISFYLHRRTGVATAGGTVHVVPAGEFQPSTDKASMISDEFDLRSTIIREYAEEFLGEADVQDPAEHDPRLHPDEYHYLKEVVLGGGARLHYLGIGLYPLTWKPEILVVSVFDDKVFDKVFAGMVESMFEGELLVTERLRKSLYALRGKKGPYQGLSFTEDVVCQYRDSSATLPAARACLALAWRHREALGIDPGRRTAR